MRKLLIICCLFLTQTLHATTFGPLANFDVVNDTGKVAHGFEIDIHDIHESNITSIFGAANRWPGMERYGVPVVTEYTDPGIGLGYGVRIRYEDLTKSTPSGTLPVSPNDSCWPYGAPTYGPNYPCDHFGVSTNVNTPSVKYSWLVETAPGASSVVLEQANVPNPNWVVVVPAPIPQPPINNIPQPPIQPPAVVNVVIRAPEPLPAPELPQPQFGEPQWVRVTATGLGYPVAVEDLVAENKVIKEAEKNVQVEWQLIQTDPGNPAAGQIDLSGVAPDPGFQSIVYRFEYYKYTGPRNDVAHGALPADADNQATPVADTYGAPNSPPASELGDFIVANNAAINLNGEVLPAPPLPAPPIINASFVEGTVGTPYSQSFIITPENPIDSLVTTVSNLPIGWSFDGVKTISGSPVAADVGVHALIIKVVDATNRTESSLTTNLTIVDIVPPPAPVACSGTNEKITQIDPGAGGINPTPGFLVTDKGLNRVRFPDQAHTILAPGLNTFIVGDIIQYSGFLDLSKVFCLADTMTVSKVLNLNTVIFGNGQAGIDYSPVDISTVGGFPPATIDIAGLPTGVSLVGTKVGGIPLQSGIFPLTITATDFTNQRVISSNSITIDAAPVVNVSAVLSTGTVGTQYPDTNVTTSGGIGNITLSQTGLPSGLQLNSNIISGKPTVAGQFNVVLTGKDSYGTIGTAIVSLVINPAVVVPPVNTCPVSGVKSVGQFKVVAVGATSITMSNGKVVNYLPCTKISWNRKSKSHVFKVGDSVEWKGFIVNGSIVANKLTVN